MVKVIGALAATGGAGRVCVTANAGPQRSTRAATSARREIMGNGRRLGKARKREASNAITPCPCGGNLRLRMAAHPTTAGNRGDLRISPADADCNVKIPCYTAAYAYLRSFAG